MLLLLLLLFMDRSFGSQHQTRIRHGTDRYPGQLLTLSPGWQSCGKSSTSSIAGVVFALQSKYRSTSNATPAV